MTHLVENSVWRHIVVPEEGPHLIDAPMEGINAKRVEYFVVGRGHDEASQEVGLCFRGMRRVGGVLSTQPAGN